MFLEEMFTVLVGEYNLTEKTGGSVQCSQEPVTSPYPELDEHRHQPSHSNSLRSILILSSNLGLRLHSGLPD
jgi:hypothetical protein